MGILQLGRRCSLTCHCLTMHLLRVLTHFAGIAADDASVHVRAVYGAQLHGVLHMQDEAAALTKQFLHPHVVPVAQIIPAAALVWFMGGDPFPEEKASAAAGKKRA